MEGNKLDILSKLENLEKQIELLENKLKEYSGKLNLLKAENKKLTQDVKLLEEENKKLQNYYREFLQLRSKTEQVKQKIKKLVEKISAIV